MSHVERDDLIARADPYILLTVHAHLTGDRQFIDRAWQAGMNPQRSADDLAPDLVASVSAAVRDLVAAGGVRHAASPDMLRELVEFCVGERVPDEYAAMLLEESGLLPRALDLAAPVDAEVAQAGGSVAIIGSGLSGIALGIQLKRSGIPFTIYEKNPKVGGTWYENTYPGCGVDTTSHFYTYSFELNPDWPRYFCRQRDVLDYIERCTEKYGLTKHIRLGCEVRQASYDEAGQQWRFTYRDADGTEREEAARILVSCVGQLNVPSYPRIEGLDRFEGPVVHTARWPSDLHYRNKRVALLGSGASAVQVGPTIAAEVERLLVFQRSPQWLSFRPNYHLTVPDDEQWLHRHVPYYLNWHRTQIMWAFSDRLYPALMLKESGGGGDVVASEANEQLRRQLTDHILRKVGHRPDLLPKVLPDYPPLAKRIPVDFGWLDMLLRDNVDLITDGVASVDGSGIVTSDGARYPVDVIVLATGFQATRMLQRIDIRGRAGEELQRAWQGDDPRAYLGMAVPGFPNFFVVYGPNTNLGHGGSLIFQGECQARYLAAAIRHLIGSGAREIEVKQSSFEDYNKQLDEQLSKMVWSIPGVSNWFRNSKGRVATNSPWRVVDYWQRTRMFEPQHYIVR